MTTHLTVSPTRWIAPVALLLLAGGAASSLSADTIPGVYVAGELRYKAKQCSTCGVQAGELSSEQLGGEGVVSVAGSYESPGRGGWLASGAIVGDDALPELKAAASANITIEPMNDGVGTYEWASFGSVEAIQTYTFLGDVEEWYEIAFVVDGTVSGDSLESVYASLGIYGLYDGATPDFFGSESSAFSTEDFASVNVKVTDFGTSGTFAFEQTRILGFLAEPGRVYYLDANLSAAAGTGFTSGPGYADASHTFSAAFTAGNTAWLTPGLRPDPFQVPEPATLSSLLVACVALARRRRAPAGR